MENFMSLRQEFQNLEAICIVSNREDLAEKLGSLLADQKNREELGRRAEKCFREHLGAGGRYAETLLTIIRQAESRMMKNSV